MKTEPEYKKNNDRWRKLLFFGSSKHRLSLRHRLYGLYKSFCNTTRMTVIRGHYDVPIKNIRWTRQYLQQIWTISAPMQRYLLKTY